MVHIKLFACSLQLYFFDDFFVTLSQFALEKSGFQLTPDGQCIVLAGSIRTPCCRLVIFVEFI